MLLPIPYFKTAVPAVGKDNVVMETPWWRSLSMNVVLTVENCEVALDDPGWSGRVVSNGYLIKVKIDLSTCSPCCRETSNALKAQKTAANG